jgi:hypothetical protein
MQQRLPKGGTTCVDTYAEEGARQGGWRDQNNFISRITIRATFNASFKNASDNFQKLLKENSINCSMSRVDY